MTSHVSDRVLQQLSDFIAARLGLHFPPERWRDLARGIVSAARELNFEDSESCARWLLSSPLTRSQVEILARHLTVGETYFFREMNGLDALRDRILPDLIRSRRQGEKHLRIWSTACSTGEEPYTLAILLDRLLSDANEWQVTISATDINPRSLRKAEEGVYGEWSFRSTPAWVREKYFERRNGKCFEISPRVKGMVTFSYLNLVEDAYPSRSNNTNGMDLILCRNVLMYFTPEQAAKVAQQLSLSLADGGWLVVSPVDASRFLSSSLATVNFPGVTLYRKETHRPPTIEPPPPETGGGPEGPSAAPLNPATAPVIVSPPGMPEHLPLAVGERPDGGDEATTLFAQGRYGEVADKILGLAALGRAGSQALALLARAYANKGELAEALAWCEKAVGADRVNPGTHYLLATILQEQGRAMEAAASLRRALFLDHNFVMAHFALGNLARRQGNAKEAEKHFRNALSLLRGYEPEEILPESEGITAGRLAEIIGSTIHRETHA